MPDDLEQLQREVRELRTAVEALQADVKRIRSALGTLCICVEGSQHEKTDKLDSVDMDSRETFYMPAAFCFDISRKLDYIFMTMRPFADDADRGIARRVLSDNEKAYKRGMRWEEAARTTERVFLKVLREMHDEHEQLLREAAR
jgi:hypothetical protein